MPFNTNLKKKRTAKYLMGAKTMSSLRFANNLLSTYILYMRSDKAFVKIKYKYRHLLFKTM